MSGVFGIVSIEGRTGKEDLLARMGRAMSHRPWYQVDARYDPGQGIGLGRVGIGIFNAEPQPVVSADGLLWACMAGEFYDVGQIRQDLQHKGYACDDATDAELALLLYQDQGAEFVSAVEGIFAIAIWDRS